MRFGAVTLPNRPWEQLVERWRTLDDLGFESIWVADHLANPLRTAQPWFEAWSCLAAMALVTGRARIGPLVSPLTFRNPGVLAKAAVTVDHASGGRLELAVGAGGAPFDHALTGVDAWQPRERAQRFGAFVERLHELLADDSLQPRPLQGRIPLTIGGQAEGTLRLAARYADRWNTFGGHGLSPAEAVARSRARNERLTELCEEIGRGRSEVRRSIVVGHGFVNEEPWRSEQAFLDMVDRWRGAGFDELIVYYPPQLGMPEGSVTAGVFERVAREHMPALREG